MNKREFLALAALLHDIGKVVQRASKEPTKMTHQEFGAEWIKQCFKKTPYEKLSDFALYHHFNSPKNPELDASSIHRNDILLLALADDYSSGENGEEEFSDLMRPLRSVFSLINREQKPRTAFYRPQRLSKGIFFSQNQDRARPTTQDYQELLNEFEKSLRKLFESKPLKPDAFLNILEEYFSLIPSHTAKVDGTDVSLFDHLKITAAIAVSLYNYLVENYKDKPFLKLSENEILDRKTERFMFVGVDISGIQDFIYTISSKGALKFLRARSFYIEILLEFVAMKLLKNLNLFRTNLLFLGGGNFVILAQNSDRAKKLIDKTIGNFNEELFEKHQGRLWLAYAMVRFNGETFKNSISDILGKLQEKLQDAKMHKFSSFSKDLIFDPKDADGRYECEVCGVEIKEEDWRKEHKCSVCRNMMEVGKQLPKAKYIVYKPSTQNNSIGKISIYKDETLSLFDKEKFPDGEIVWLINPKSDEPPGGGITLYLGNYPERGRNFDPDIDREEAESAPVFNYFGSELVGTLRMDVDNLGVIFSSGLPPESYSISRLATLSRFFNLFFRRYINAIAKGKLGKIKQFSIVHPDKNAPREVVVVYAGGDDLFIVGAWHDVVEMAFDIREAFYKFVGGNHITLSGGLALNHLKHPIHLFAKNAGEAEEKAKSRKANGKVLKDAFTAFGKTMGWSEWKEILLNEDNGLLKIREEFFDKVEALSLKDREIEWGAELQPNYLPNKSTRLPRSFIYRMMWVSDQLEKEGFKLRPFAILAYMLGKTKEKNPLFKHFDMWLNLKNWEKLRNFKPALWWLDLLIRGKKEVLK